MFYEYTHLGSVDYLKLESGRNFCFPPHLHRCFEIIVLLSGEMTVTVDQKPFLLEQGDALLICPNQIHALESTQSEHILCIFSPDLVAAYTTKLGSRIPVDNRFRPDAYLVNALSGLEQASSVEKKGTLYSLCGQFHKNAKYEEKISDTQTLLHKIFAFVEEHYTEDCSLAELARNTGYDYAYLSRVFKRIVGISFNSYVNQYRLSRACYLMENTTEPVIRCAFDSGSGSLRSFNRNFRELFGCTPAQYRKTKQE